MDWKLSDAGASGSVFNGLIIRQCETLVGLNPTLVHSEKSTATHLTPTEFHEKALEDGTIIIDVRNSYEHAIGHFEGAISPETRSFDEFDGWARIAAEELCSDKKQVLMYCTGGIRCEKASIQLKQYLKDDLDVYQLKGGIHRYIEEFKEEGNSLFKGDNFVFDKRVVQKGFGSIGKCSVCEKPYDRIEEKRRCKKCRILILVCDECEEVREQKYWCNRHKTYDLEAYARDNTLLPKLVSELDRCLSKVEGDDFQGRRNRSKRKSMKKRIEELEQIKNTLNSTRTHKV